MAQTGHGPKRSQWGSPLGIGFVLILFVSAGCVGPHAGGYGSIVPDGEIGRSFETYQPDPGLQYYISGSDALPNAIMGLDKTYALESTLWKKVAMTPQALRDLVTHMHIAAPIMHGFALIDPQGKRIGVWYSILSATTWLRMQDEHTVVIATPELHTYEKIERWNLDKVP